MKGFLGTLVTGIGMVLLIFMAYYGREFTDLFARDSHIIMGNLSNSLFLVGLVTFFVSLIMLTNASDIFIAFGYTVRYTLRAIFGGRRRNTYMQYYDYLKQKRRDKDERSGSVALTAFFMSIAMISVSLYIAYNLAVI